MAQQVAAGAADFLLRDVCNQPDVFCDAHAIAVLDMMVTTWATMQPMSRPFFHRSLERRDCWIRDTGSLGFSH